MFYVGSNSGPVDLKLNLLTTQPGIYSFVLILLITTGYIDFYTTTNDNITMTSIASSSMTLNNNTTLNDQESLCACQQCKKFGKIHDQVSIIY